MRYKLLIISVLLCGTAEAIPLNEGFESGVIPSSWTVINNDADTNEWHAYQDTAYAHSGQWSAAVYWNPIQNDDWLITPGLIGSSGDTFSFWARSRSWAYREDFNVLVSTTTPEITSFTDTLDTVRQIPSSYNEYSYSLDSYAGQYMYVAIQCVSQNEWILFVDDFIGPEIAPPPAPNIWIADTIHDFGSVLVGDTAYWNNLWIKNTGDSVLEVTGIIPSNARFGIVSPSFPQSITPGDSIVVVSRFTPIDTVDYSGILTVYSNDPDEPEIGVHVYGEGCPHGPNIWVSDTTHDFGLTVIGDTAYWNNLWIKNAGDSVLDVTGIIPSSARFGIVSPSFPQSISPGDSIVVVSRFIPIDTIDYSGTLTVHSNALNEPELPIHVYGRGCYSIGPDIWISDTIHDFGAVTVGDTGYWNNLCIKNEGDSILVVQGIIPSNVAFGVVSPGFPVDLDPEDSIVVTIRFVPSDTTNYTGELTVYSNDPDEPEVIIHVTGTGIGVEEQQCEREWRLQIYPNPCGRWTYIRYELPIEGRVTINIYDITGRLVKNIVSGESKPGWYEIELDTKGIGSGIYFCVLKTDGITKIKKLVISEARSGKAK